MEQSPGYIFKLKKQGEEKSIHTHTYIYMCVYTHTHTHTHTRITESLCCIPETNTTLYINYISIKIKQDKNKKSMQM